ncbi:MAG: T9SS type A sorting domain-containing protein, partial [Ignavibacteria bacterium]
IYLDVTWNNNLLPVELSSFVSVINENNVTLNWSTSTETNNAGFDIERSSFKGTWTKIGSVSGNGTSTTPHSYSFSDRAVASGKYNYRLKQVDFNGNFEYHNLGNEVIIGVPAKFDLSQNYPNPFNPSTKINYDLPTDGSVSIKLFDLSGKEVASLVNEVKTAGYHTVDFNASNLSSGVYFYNISVDANGNNFSATKRMMLVK